MSFDPEDRSSIANEFLPAQKQLSSTFDRLIRKDKKIGAQFVVIKDGKIIIDRWGGSADFRHRVPVLPTTKFQAFSISKSLIAACILRLVDSGKIQLDGKVAEYWPEFGENGKGGISIRQVLLHQAGLPRRGIYQQIINIGDLERNISDLAKQYPEYPPGEKTAYHVLNFGFILGEVIDKISGNSLEEFLLTEFSLPLGLKDTSMTLSTQNLDQSARISSGTIDQLPVAWFYNSRKLKQAVIPGGSLHTTARNLAVFFQMLLNEGRYGGIQFLKSKSIQEATSLGYEGYDASYERITRWGLGFNLGGEHDLNNDIPDGMGMGSSVETFGHYGQRSSAAWADKKERIVFVFLCNRLISHIGYKERLRVLSDVVWNELRDK